MTTSKRAAAAEQRDKKISAYKIIILGLVGQVQTYPFFDYSSALEDLIKKHPADRAEILAAEREAYKDYGKK